jgi:hypothetical protein
MTEHLRLQGKVLFARTEPMALKEFVHEFQIVDQPVRQSARSQTSRSFPP